MNLIGIELRDIIVKLKVSLAEMRNLQRFLELAIPIFKHIHGDNEQELMQKIIEFEEQLLSINKNVEESIQDDS